MSDCAVCGGTVAPRLGADRTAWYRRRRIAIPEDVAIPTCGTCGTEWDDAETATALDRVLRPLWESLPP